MRDFNTLGVLEYLRGISEGIRRRDGMVWLSGHGSHVDLLEAALEVLEVLQERYADV